MSEVPSPPREPSATQPEVTSPLEPDPMQPGGSSQGGPADLTQPAVPVPRPAEVGQPGGAGPGDATLVGMPSMAVDVVTQPAPAPELTPTTPAELTAQVGSGTVPAANRQRLWARAQALNWRLYLVRFICAGLAVLLTVVLLPGLRFVEVRWGLFTEIAVIFGLLNALVKPVLQFLVLRFIFSTYGLVIVVINVLLLLLLDSILGDVIEVTSILSAILGGLGVGVFGLMFETLLGANPPILDSARREREARG